MSTPAEVLHTRPPGSGPQLVITRGVGFGRFRSAGSLALSAGVPVTSAGGGSEAGGGVVLPVCPPHPADANRTIARGTAAVSAEVRVRPFPCAGAPAICAG